MEVQEKCSKKMNLSPDITMVTMHKFYPTLSSDTENNYCKLIKTRKSPRMKPSRLFPNESALLLRSGRQAIKQLPQEKPKQKSRTGRNSVILKSTENQIVMEKVEELAEILSMPQLSSESSSVPLDLFGNSINPSSPMAQSLQEMSNQDADMKEMPALPVIAHPSSLEIASSGESTVQKLTKLMKLMEKQKRRSMEPEVLDTIQLIIVLQQLKQDNQALENHIDSLEQKKSQLMAIHSQLHQIVIGYQVEGDK